MEKLYTYQLPNGIRGIHRTVRSDVAYCALIINAGTRDELADEFGLAHFTEHALFKGTEHRRAYHINCRLENLGGELNAYTTKEETTIHATVLKRDIAKAAELISDIAFHSTFPEKELAREREVVADEINSYKDSPADMIYDTFEDMIFEGSQLGHNILGRKAALKNYTTERIHRFVNRTHTTDQMVFASVGNISERRIREIAERYFATAPSSERNFKRIGPAPIARFEKSISKHLHQAHCIIGGRAYSLNDERRLPLALLINTLGGPCANSLLNIAVRERNGLTYNIEATYTPYTDTGAASIYFSSDRDKIDRCRELVAEQIGELCRNSLSARQLAIAKKQYMGQVAIAMESREAYMLGTGKSYLIYNEVEPIEKVYSRVEAITREQIADIANEIFGQTSTLIYK
ncbi:MAG: insulinase family protein [Rikenellaceae bacterium]|nr:insulinase family protein [Rikenellaceae bacterium]MBQ5719236.1 insulinase family protein [Alistipes sp.]